MIDQTLTELIQGDAPNGVILDRLREIHTGKDDEALATAYIVVGETGEYSDHRDWYVAAFLDKDAADALCKKLNDWCKERNLDADDNRHVNWEDRHRFNDECPDPHFDCDYHGTVYSVCPIPLKG